jgi:drug/metabolite transporter (DMT)-like permease
MSIALTLVACVAWAVYCGVLTRCFDQPQQADSLATLLGLIVIIFATPPF